jgi:hypothetical protein
LTATLRREGLLGLVAGSASAHGTMNCLLRPLIRTFDAVRQACRCDSTPRP